MSCNSGCRCGECEKKIFTSEVFYDGSYLQTLNIVPQDDMNIVLEKINSFLSNGLPTIDVVGGNGISVSKVSDTYTVVNTKPNVTQTITLAGNTLVLSNGGGSVVIPTGAAQQNVDWNATSGVTQILNKPTIPSNQTLTWVDASRELTISSGNTVTIPGGVYGAGVGISISGNTITNTEPNQNQQLGLTGNSLSLTNGGSVNLPTADGSETKVQVTSGLNISGTGKSSDPYIIGNTSQSIQSDWTETDSSAPSFIKNKPLDPDGFKTYYVDGNNSVAGDGSILNPFQTLDQAINKVIGTGSRANPQNKGITVKVFSFEYITGLNLFADTISWEFDTGVLVNYTGPDFLFNTSGVNFTKFIVSGKWNFSTVSGSLIQVDSPTSNSRVDLEINDATQTIANVTDPFTQPMIRVATNYGLADWVLARLSITLHGEIRSDYNTTIFTDGYAGLWIKGLSAFATLTSGNGQPSANLPTQRVLHYNNGDTSSSSYMYSQMISVQDVAIRSDGTSAVTIGGLCGGMLFSNINFRSTQAATNKQTSSIEIDDLTVAKYNTTKTKEVLIKNCYFQRDIYTGAAPYYAVTYIGSEDGTSLEMSGNLIPKPYLIHPKLNLNAERGVMQNTASNLNVKTLPIYADQTAAITGGLVSGDQFITSTGQLFVVI